MDENKLKNENKVGIYSIVITSCFILRAIVSIYVAVTDSETSYFMISLCNFWIPEIIPSLLQLLFIQNEIKKEEYTKDFISELYPDTNALEIAISDNVVRYVHIGSDDEERVVDIPIMQSGKYSSHSFDSFNRFPDVSE